MFSEFFETAPRQCYFVRRAIERFREMKSRKEFYFDENAAARIVRYISLFRHFEGDFRGRPFELLPFQKFVLGNIFGWKWKDGGQRVIKTAYIEVPRKNGKTTLAAPVAGYMMTSDGEGGSQVYTVATKEEQAKICWRAAIKLFKSNKDFAKRIKFRVKSVEYDKMDAFLRPLGADSQTLDGLNPHCVIADELHKWQDPHLWEVLRGGMGVQSQPLMFGITTAGNEQSETSICFRLRKHAENILKGAARDWTFFPMIYTIDDGDDPLNPEVWAKANPALGHAKTLQYMNERAGEAKNFASAMNDFLNQQLNIWTQSNSLWIGPVEWDSMRVKNEPDLRGKRCYGGLDLSHVSDLTAFVLVFPKQDGIEKTFVKSFFFIPEASAVELEDKYKLPVKDWHRSGEAFIWPERIIRLSQVAEFIASLKNDYDIRNIFYDRAGARETETILKESGLEIEPSFQGFMLSKDINKIEELVMSKELAHDGNRCMAWNIQNCVVKENIKREKMLVKPFSMAKIDGAIALAMAVGAMTVNEVVNPPKSKFFYSV